MYKPCKICRLFFKAGGLYVHIVKRHNLSIFNYAVKYLGHSINPPVCSCGCNQSVIKWNGIEKGWAKYVRGHNPQDYSKRDWKSMGKKVSQTLIKKYKSGEIIPPRLGKNKYNDEYFRKASEEMSGRKVSDRDKFEIAKTLRKKFQSGEIVVWNKGLTKESDIRMSNISKNLLGKPLTEDHKQNVSNSVKNLHNQENSPYNDEWHINMRESWEQKIKNGYVFWAQTEEGRKFMADAVTIRNKEGKMLIDNSKLPTKPEAKIIKWFGDYLEYTGNGRLWFTWGGRHKNPDFVSKVNKNVIVEVFGNYWHKKEEEMECIYGYKSIGKDCLVIWEKEIIKFPDQAKIKIINFLKENTAWNK